MLGVAWWLGGWLVEYRITVATFFRRGVGNTMVNSVSGSEDIYNMFAKLL